MSSSRQEVEVHWLFRPSGKNLSCLGIQVFPDGDYLVIDSPTGTYMAGHADRGRWRLEHDRYVAEGYIPELEAKAAGLVSESWSRQPPPPPWVRKRHIARAVGVAVLTIALGILIWLVRRA